MAAKVTMLLLGGQSRPLFYGTAAVIQAEARMGKSIRDAIIGQSIADLVTLLWAGLRVGTGGVGSRLTPEEVAGWLDEAKKGEVVIFTLWDRVAEALAASGIIPTPRQTEAPGEDNALDPTSSSPRPGVESA